jgi:hypothetical protein
MKKPTLALLLLVAGCAAATEGVETAERSTSRVYTDEGIVAVEHVPSLREESSTLEMGRDGAFSVVQKAYAEVGVTPGTLDSAAGLVGTREQRVRRIAGERPSTFLDCGSGIAGPNADHYDVYLTALTQLHPLSAGRTELRTRVEAIARDASQGSSVVRCTTRGVLERRIAAAAEALAG